MEYPDIMVDLETTGTDYGHCAIIEIAAVRFNLREGKVSPDFFDRCLLIPEDRFWQEGGRGFWMKHKEVLQNQIMPRMEDPATVLQAFADWAGYGDLTLWAKPTHFEHPFLSNYFTRYGIRNPFHYRLATDMNSFFRGLHYPEAPPDFERTLPFTGSLHNALDDTLHQLKVLFAHMAEAKARGEA